MKLSIEKFLVISGLSYFIISFSYLIVYLANYDSFISDSLFYEFQGIKFLLIENAERFDPGLIWGLSLFWGVFLLIYLTLWNNNQKEKIHGFVSIERISVGFLPLIVALGYDFGLGLKNEFLLGVTGAFSMVTIVLLFHQRDE